MDDRRGGRVADDAAAYRVLERLRWGSGPVPCPGCGAQGQCALIRPRDGSGRATRTGARTGRRVWRCGTCRRQFTVLTGSVLEGTRVPVTAWLRAADLLARAPAPVTAARVRAATGLGPEAARDVLARWRAVMAVLERRDASP